VGGLGGILEVNRDSQKDDDEAIAQTRKQTSVILRNLEH